MEHCLISPVYRWGLYPARYPAPYPGTLPGDTLPGTLPGGTLPLLGFLPGGTLPGTLPGDGHFKAIGTGGVINYDIDWTPETAGTYEAQLVVVSSHFEGCRITRSPIVGFSVNAAAPPPSAPPAGGGGAAVPTATPEPPPPAAAAVVPTPLPAADIAGAAAGPGLVNSALADATSTGQNLAEAAATDADAAGAALAVAAATDADAAGAALAAAAAIDPDAIGAALAAAAGANADAVGAALAAAAAIAPDAVGAALAAAADADATGAALAAAAEADPDATGAALNEAMNTDASAGRRPTAVGLALAAGPAQDRFTLALLGNVAPVEPWVPERSPPRGRAATGDGEWQDVGSPAPIDKILTRFASLLPGARVDVADVLALPAGVPALPPSRIVNSYLTLDPVSFGNEDVAAAHTTLFLDKSWLEANQIHEWSIQFSRFNEELSAWTPVQSKRVSEDEARVFFSVAMPRFSLWAISGSVEAPSL